MARTLAGTLNVPDTGPLANAEIYFVAKRNEATKILQGVSSVITTDSSGEYSQSIEDGYYAISIRYDDGSGNQLHRYPLGEVFVESGSEITLNALLAVNDAAVDPTVAGLQQLLADAQEARDEAVDAASSSQQSSEDAAQVLADAVLESELQGVLLDNYDVRPALPGSPSLSLNFVKNEYMVYEGIAGGFQPKTLSAAVQVSRATPEPGVAAGGILSEAAADELPLVFNPGTGESLGAQILGEYTNMLLWSENFSNSVWLLSSATVVQEGSYYLLEASDTSNNSYIRQAGVLGPQSGVTTLTATIKKKVSDEIMIGNHGSSSYRAVYNLDTGEFSNIGANVVGVDASILGNGDHRVSITVNNDGNPSDYIIIYARLFSGQPGSVLLRNCQLTQTGWPAPYLKTEGSQVTKPETVVLKDDVPTYPSFTLIWKGRLQVRGESGQQRATFVKLTDASNEYSVGVGAQVGFDDFVRVRFRDIALDSDFVEGFFVDGASSGSEIIVCATYDSLSGVFLAAVNGVADSAVVGERLQVDFPLLVLSERSGVGGTATSNASVTCGQVALYPFAVSEAEAISQSTPREGAP